MSTEFPDAEDTTWEDPDGGDSLSTSPDGRTHSEHHIDLQDVVLDMESSLVGPTFRSAAAYDARAELVIDDCEATTGWTSVNTTAVVSDSTRHSVGTKSVRFTNCNVGWTNNGDLTTKMYKNLSADQLRDERLHLSLDILWSSTDFGDDDVLRRFFKLVVSDSTALGGNTVVWNLPNIVESNFTTVTVPIIELTKVRSFGLVSYAQDNGPSSTLIVNFDNVVLGAQTALERAIGANPDGGVLVPPSYDSTGQSTIVLPSSTSVVDYRSDYVRVRGERDVRTYQLPLDGVTDVTTDVQDIFNSLQDGDRLSFPRGYRFLVSSGMLIKNLTDIDLDFNGCKFYTQQSVIDGHLFKIDDCRYLSAGNVRLYGYAPDSRTGTDMTTFAGTPGHAAGEATLATQGDAVIIYGQNQGYTVDDEIPFAITMKQSGSATDDVAVEIVDTDAPATAPTVTATSAGNGPIQPGVYYYGVSYVDIDGHETTMGPRVGITLATGDTITLTNIPIADAPQYVGRKIYRSASVDLTDDPRNYGLVIHIPNNTTTTLVDNAKSNSKNPSENVTGVEGAAGALAAGQYHYYFTAVYPNGTESGHSSVADVTITASHRITVTVPVTSSSFSGGAVKRKLYRTLVNAAGSVAKNYYLVTTINDNTTTSYDDNAADASISSNIHPPFDNPSTSDLPTNALFTTYFTPGASYGVKTFVWKPVAQRDHPRVIARKVSTAVNTISISGATVTTQAAYDGAAETSSGFTVSGTSKHIDIHDVFATLMGEEAVFVNGAEVEGVTARRIVSYGNRRQGMAMNSGTKITFEDCDIYHPGRSGIDIEPYAGNNFASQIVLRRIRIYAPKNAAIASASNWHKIRGLIVHDVYAFFGGDGIGCGAQGGRMFNCTCWWGDGSAHGQNVHVTNCDFQALDIGGSTKTTAYDWDFQSGGIVADNIRLLEDDITDDGSGDILTNIFLVSGPVTGAATVTDITP